MQNRQTARWFRYALVFAVLLGLIAMALWPTSLKVDAATIDKGRVRQVLEAQGQTRLQTPYLITAPAAANARRIRLSPGDAVKKGDLLVELEPVQAVALDARSRAEAQARLAAARAAEKAALTEVALATAQAAQASKELERLSPLADQGMVSASAYDQAKTAQKQAALSLRSADFRASTAKAQAEAVSALLTQPGQAGPDVSANAEASAGVVRLYAPIDGVVIRRHIDSDQPVATGAPLLELGDIANMEVQVDVLSADAVRLREGMQAELLRTGAQGVLQGVITRIEPAAFTKVSALGVEEQRVWVIIGINSPRAEWAKLGEGYRVHARFVLEQAEEALRAPGSAVFKHGDSAAVFRLVNGKAELTPVTIGLTGEGYRSVKEGLNEGDVVIVHPPRDLASGTRVTVP
ncbi:HlyD family efflux transporter periplasmic adaptor subunit [Hydrogenophaga sp. 5NK40-0174]|uniref:efflux RND transporter periplasmic adaptor subunit n=1 Tax=Hydrogenophaga sp. 5NK40-0174 TaxID=3127649 RepID=UPI0031041B8E